VVAFIKIRDSGRVTIPVALRKQAGLVKGTLVNVTFERGKIFITPEWSLTPAEAKKVRRGMKNIKEGHFKLA
jgi:bifunctional DNA-binding transcriptional regulator/antitoxin component of YhaV-PrlF toxin-antitoxin module